MIFNAQFNTHFDDEELDTIGGLIMQALDLPKRGEEITLENIQFKVTSADSYTFNSGACNCAR